MARVACMLGEALQLDLREVAVGDLEGAEGLRVPVQTQLRSLKVLADCNAQGATQAPLLLHQV